MSSKKPYRYYYGRPYSNKYQWYKHQRHLASSSKIRRYQRRTNMYYSKNPTVLCNPQISKEPISLTNKDFPQAIKALNRNGYIISTRDNPSKIEVSGFIVRTYTRIQNPEIINYDSGVKRLQQAQEETQTITIPVERQQTVVAVCVYIPDDPKMFAICNYYYWYEAAAPSSIELEPLSGYTRNYFYVNDVPIRSEVTLRLFMLDNTGTEIFVLFNGDYDVSQDGSYINSKETCLFNTNLFEF